MRNFCDFFFKFPNHGYDCDNLIWSTLCGGEGARKISSWYLWWFSHNPKAILKNFWILKMLLSPLWASVRTANFFTYSSRCCLSIPHGRVSILSFLTTFMIFWRFFLQFFFEKNATATRFFYLFEVWKLHMIEDKQTLVLSLHSLESDLWIPRYRGF